jgi:hypothetical protein
MEPVVTLDGVKKLPGTPERLGSAGKAKGQAGPSVPLDGVSVLYTGLGRDTLLIAGVGDAFAGVLPAIFNDDPKTTLPCAVAVLPSGQRMSGTKHPFVAVLSLPSGASRRSESVTIRSQGHSYPYILKHRVDNLDLLLQKVIDLTSHTKAVVIDGLVQALLAGGSTSQSMRTVERIVDAVAGREGCVEILGAFDTGEVYVQGWVRGMPAGISKVFVMGSCLRLSTLSSCLFERTDIDGKAYGFAGLLDVEGEFDAASVRKVFFRSRSGWSAVEVYDHKVMPPARALPSHIQALLPKLHPSGDGWARLEKAGRRFDGRETVSELDVPVRIGIDFSASLDRAGVLLSGWLLNPEGRVEAVLYRSAGKVCRIDTRWTTQQRPDVTRAFEDLSPFLRGPDALQRHGFLTYIPGEELSETEGAYLEIVLKDGRSAYAPLTLGRASPKSALRRLCSSLDPATAFRPDVLERHMLPIVQAAVGLSPVIAETIEIGSVPEHGSCALVIGLDEDFEKTRILLSLCALDPALQGVPIVLAISRSQALEQIEDFKQIAGFYGLAARLVLADHIEDTLDALQAGVEASPVETVVCLSSGVLPRAPGWLEPLFAAFQEHEGASIVAPTLLYEDDTIRWGGSWIEPEDDCHKLKQHYLGYPRRILQGADVGQVAAAHFDCCVVSRSALSSVGGFSRKYLGTDEKGLDAALRMKRSGIGSVWVPQVEMLYADDGRLGERHWKKLVCDLDRRSFERTWTPILPDLMEDAV